MAPRKARRAMLYLGGSEWSISEVKEVERHRVGDKKKRRGYILCGLTDYPTKSIYLRRGLGRERYEVMFHEGIHAVCSEGRFNESLSALRDDEEAVTFLSKMMVGYLRQTRDWTTKRK